MNDQQLQAIRQHPHLASSATVANLVDEIIRLRALAIPKPAQPPIGEVVAWPDDTNPRGVEWGNEGVPPVGTKLFASAPQPAQKPATLCDCKGRFYDRCESAWEPYCVLGKSAEHAAVSKIAMPKPNVHMDGYVRTDRPNGDGL